MAATAPKKRRKRRTPTMAAPRKRRVHHAKPAARRRRRLGDSGTTSLWGSVKNGFKGAAGGAIHEVPRFFTKLDTVPQIGFDIVGTVLLATLAKQPAASAGFAGAATSRWMDRMFKKSMNDDLQDFEYVDPNTLSDSGFDDEFGDAVVMDDDGNLFALSDDGETYEMIGHMDDMDDDGMNDDFGDDLEDVSMIPLQGGNPYALSNEYALQ